MKQIRWFVMFVAVLLVAAPVLAQDAQPSGQSSIAEATWFLGLVVLFGMVVAFAKAYLKAKHPSVAEFIDKYGGYAVSAVMLAEKMLAKYPGLDKLKGGVAIFLKLAESAGNPPTDAQLEKAIGDLTPDEIEERLKPFGLTAGLVAQGLSLAHAKYVSTLTVKDTTP